ncbi:MAG: 4Fe-4S dicluster domain-containing protein [Promethearchaeota archaeon]|nr:MAG: 4Fe-4S dicluster domain-containing protein [Candidatus Lokiarchaeota archaeon]
MSFPKVSKDNKGKKDAVKVQFLADSLEIVLDKEKCTGCCACVRACPKEAFSRYQPEGPKELFGKQIIYKKKKYQVPFIYDPLDCSYCGLCTFICPFDALRLKVNGEEVPPEKLKLVQEKAVPQLDYKNVKLEDGREVKVYTKGSLTIDVNMCNTGCYNCAEICPSGAISMKPDIVTKKRGEYEQELEIEIEESKCLYCGACHEACPTGALKLTIDEVCYSGEYNSPFWDEAVERLKISPDDTSA